MSPSLPWLSRLERAIVECLLKSEPLPRHKIHTQIEAALGPVGESRLCEMLARMSDPEVGILVSKRGQHGGYRLSRGVRDWLRRKTPPSAS